MFPYLYKYIPITASSNKTVHASIFVNFTQVYALHWNHLATYVDATCGACTVFIPLATAYEGKYIRLRYIPICHCLEFNFIKWEDFSYWVLVLWTKHPESNTFRIESHAGQFTDRLIDLSNFFSFFSSFTEINEY